MMWAGKAAGDLDEPRRDVVGVVRSQFSCWTTPHVI